MVNTLKMLTSQLWNVHFTRMFILLVEYGLMHRGDCINCETCYFCFDPAFVWPSLGRADFHSAQLVNPFRVFVRVPEQAGDARQWWQLGLCLCSLTEQTGAARSTAQILDALPASVRRLTLFTDMLCQSVTVTCCSPFVHALSNEAGAGQFMTNFLPLTAAWSQVPPMSLSVWLCA